MSEISRACGGGDGGRSLVPGTLRGYRTWRPAGRRVHVPAGALPLTSVTRRRVVWPETLVARCTPAPVGRRQPQPPSPPPPGPPPPSTARPDPTAATPGGEAPGGPHASGDVPGGDAPVGDAPARPHASGDAPVGDAPGGPQASDDDVPGGPQAPGDGPVGGDAVAAHHRAPQAGCDCGIYAWFAPDDTRILHARVFGVVEASGLVLMGERGFRAEKVRIRAVATRHRRVAAACAAAGIPVYRRRSDLVREHPPEDLSALLGDRDAERDDGSEEPDADPSLPSSRVDRALVLAVWARTAFLALAVGLLPVAAAVLCVAVAELALVGLIVTRLR